MELLSPQSTPLRAAPRRAARVGTTRGTLLALEPERFPFKGVVYERPRHRFWTRMGAFAFLAMMAWIIAASVGPVAGMFAVIAGILLVPLVQARLSGTKRATSSDVVLQDGVLRVPSLELEIKKDQIRQGTETGADGRVLLDLVDKELLRLDFGAQSDIGERLVSRLGVSVEQRTLRVPLRGQIGAFVMGLCTMLFGVFPSAMVAAPLVESVFGRGHGGLTVAFTFALMTLLTTAVVRRFGSPHVIVGSDGIRVRGTLRQPYIPYSQIKAVHATGWYVILDLVNGKRRVLPVIAVDSMRVRGLVKRIDRARRRATAGASVLSDSLGRAGRTIEDWRTALAGLARREASFREAAVDPDEVVRIATDPLADADQRVGAAFVLRELDPEGPARIRIAADATADDDLKAALLAAAEGELDSEAVERAAKRRI